VKVAELAVRIALHEILRIVPKFVGVILQRRVSALFFRVDVDDPVADDVFNATPLAFLFESLCEGIQVYVILDVERNVARVPCPTPTGAWERYWAH